MLKIAGGHRRATVRRRPATVRGRPATAIRCPATVPSRPAAVPLRRVAERWQPAITARLSLSRPRCSRDAGAKVRSPRRALREPSPTVPRQQRPASTALDRNPV